MSKGDLTGIELNGDYQLLVVLIIKLSLDTYDSIIYAVDSKLWNIEGYYITNAEGDSRSTADAVKVNRINWNLKVDLKGIGVSGHCVSVSDIWK